MSDTLVYDDLNDVQRAWLKKCALDVKGLELPEETYQVTIRRGSKILMRDLARGNMGVAIDFGYKLAYKAAFAYCAGPLRG